MGEKMAGKAPVLLDVKDFSLKQLLEHVQGFYAGKALSEPDPLIKELMDAEKDGLNLDNIRIVNFKSPNLLKSFVTYKAQTDALEQLLEDVKKQIKKAKANKQVEIKAKESKVVNETKTDQATTPIGTPQPIDITHSTVVAKPMGLELKETSPKTSSKTFVAPKLPPGSPKSQAQATSKTTSTRSSIDDLLEVDTKISPASREKMKKDKEEAERELRAIRSELVALVGEASPDLLQVELAIRRLPISDEEQNENDYSKALNIDVNRSRGVLNEVREKIRKQNEAKAVLADAQKKLEKLKELETKIQFFNNPQANEYINRAIIHYTNCLNDGKTDKKAVAEKINKKIQDWTKWLVAVKDKRDARQAAGANASASADASASTNASGPPQDQEMMARMTKLKSLVEPVEKLAKQPGLDPTSAENLRKHIEVIETEQGQLDKNTVLHNINYRIGQWEGWVEKAQTYQKQQAEKGDLKEIDGKITQLAVLKDIVTILVKEGAHTEAEESFRIALETSKNERDSPGDKKEVLHKIEKRVTQWEEWIKDTQRILSSRKPESSNPQDSSPVP